MSNQHVVACLWMIAAVLALGWIAGLVSIRQEQFKWSHVEPKTKHHKCVGVSKGAWCQ